MAESLVTTSIEDQLYFVTLNRPEKRNALTIEMLDELSDAICRADEHPQLRAILVSGAGPTFSAGIDVKALGQSRAEAGALHAGRWLRRLADRLQHAFHKIESTELPVIGMLHGRVLGLGLELALSFDLRVATDDCLFAMPESRLGLVADVGGTTRLCRTIGPSRTKDVLMTARSVSADEALRWGMVDRVTQAGQLAATARGLAEEIAANAPLAVGMAKLIVDQGDGLDKQSQMAIERWAQSQLITTEDFGEGVAAFLERRPAKFQGK